MTAPSSTQFLREARHIVELIAQSISAAGIEKNVVGMEGFEKHWRSRLSPNERAWVDRFYREKKRATRELLKSLPKEKS